MKRLRLFEWTLLALAVLCGIGAFTVKPLVRWLDPEGDLVDSFEGTETEFHSDSNRPRRGGPPSTVPTTAKGLNRFEWDLRFPGATVFEGMIIWDEDPLRGPKAVPGDYQVRVSALGQRQTRSLQVDMDPRSALEILMMGTDLEWNYSENGGVIDVEFARRK